MGDNDVSTTLDTAYRYIIPSVDRVDPRLASDIKRLADIVREQQEIIKRLNQERN